MSYKKKNEEKYPLFEFVGTSGSGKTTIISGLTDIFSGSHIKVSSSYNTPKPSNTELIIFFFNRFIKLYKVIIFVLFHRKLFYGPHHQKSYYLKFKRVIKLLRIAIYANYLISLKQPVFFEGLVHMLNTDCIGMESFVDKYVNLFLPNKIYFVYIDVPFQESLKRMIEREGLYKVSKEYLGNYYKNSKKIQDLFLKTVSTNRKRAKNFSYNLYVDGTDEIDSNCQNLAQEIRTCLQQGSCSN